MAHIEVIKQMTNLEVHVFESVIKDGKRVAFIDGKWRTAPNGFFRNGNQIFIDINAGNKGEGAMLSTMGHEVAHYIRRWNAKGFKELADFLFKHYGHNGVSVDALIETQKDKIIKRYKFEGKVSVDFSTLCRKRLLQQTIQGKLQEALDRSLTKEEGIAIRDALMAIQEEGRQIEIACALCYVESARMKSHNQIKKFLNNREDVLKNFFASKSGGDIKSRIKQAEAEARERLGVGNTPLTRLPANAAKEIRDAKKEAKASYVPSSKEAELIEIAKGMTVNDFATPAGLENLAKNYPELFDAYASFIVNATHAKGIENDTWWRAGDSYARNKSGDINISDTLIDNMNRENGLRSQSWSDFQVIHLLDYIAATIELSTRNSKEQIYTKVPDFVDLMGLTNAMLNMSLIPTREFNGSLEYDAVEGMPYDMAIKLREAYPNTAGTICIGIDNEQIRMLLADIIIDYVIPYHRSGMSAHTRKAMHLPTWSEYEDYQSEKNLSRADEELIHEFNYLPDDKYKCGQNIYIQRLNVPDLWVSHMYDYMEEHVYTTDEDFIHALNEYGEVQLGYYAVSVLETQKVDLTEYATKQDLADGLREVSIADGLFTERLFNEAKTHTDEQVSAVKTSIAETANAIKGKVTSEIVRVSDVSPIEHTVKCKVRSRNLFNSLDDFTLANGTTKTYNGETLVINGYYASKFIKLEEKKTYTFSFQSERTGTYGGGVYIACWSSAQSKQIYSAASNRSAIVTFTVPEGMGRVQFTFYGGNSTSADTSATYTEIMLEEGSEATEYVPYVDATTATVTRYGKNLLDLSRATFTSATYNKDVNGITCKINNSYYSGVRVDYLNDFLLANKGKTLTFSIAEAIDDVLITLLIYGTRTSGKTNQEGSTTGEREISFAISDEFTAITGLEVRVNRKTEAFTDTTTVVRNMQVEVRDTASDFEVYKEATTHTPSADGTVEGIKSISPTMTLFTDTANVVVEIEYNQDINVLNKRLVEALDAIIAIQKTLIGGTSQ